MDVAVCLNGSFQCQGSISQDSHASPTTYVDPRRQQFVCHHSSSSVGMGTWIWAPSSHVFPNSLFHAEFVVRVELTLLRFNDELRGQLLLSMGMLTPKFVTHILLFCAVIVEATEGDCWFVKRCARQRRPKVAIITALPYLPVDLHLLRCVVLFFQYMHRLETFCNFCSSLVTFLLIEHLKKPYELLYRTHISRSTILKTMRSPTTRHTLIKTYSSLGISNFTPKIFGKIPEKGDRRQGSGLDRGPAVWKDVFQTC
uniref:DUF3778 domain-containing protein n=1 Tax=Oryza barthii TaxID=65489 RepID=A0A0D3G7T4_9ORYZ